MFSSSPNSSTTSPQLTRSNPGPPRRTYAKRKIRPAYDAKRIVVGDSNEEEEEENEKEIRISSTRPRPLKGSMSSPPLGSSKGDPIIVESSESRQTRTRSGAAQSSTNGKGKDVQKAENVHVGKDEDGESEEGRGTKKEKGNGRKRARMYEQSPVRTPSTSPSPRPRPASSSPLTAISDTPTPTARRRATGEGLHHISPRRSTRMSRSSSSASLPAEKEVTPTRRRDPATPPRSVPVAGPSTPSSASPRDYAHLFTAYSPDASLISSPSRRRLIGESKSSGAVLDTPSKLSQRFAHLRDSPASKLSAGPSTPTKSLGKAMSMPISPAKSLPEDAEPDPSAMWIKPPETEPGSGGRAKRIYGKSRTVVAEDIDTVSDATKLEEALSKESYASLRSRYEVNPGDALSQAEMSELVIARAPQSANDMKSKGENRRFMDETGYLLDGIEDENATKGFRRASCVDILSNMQSEEWMSKLRVCGQTERVWFAFQAVRGDGDPIMDAVCLLTLYTITVGVGGTGTIFQADAQGCVRFVIGLLKERNGVLDEKWTGKVTSNVERMREISKNIVNLRNSVTVNTRHLASSILASVAHDLPDVLISPVLRSEKILSKTLKAILPEIASLSDRFDLVESGLPLIPQDDSIDLGHIRNGLAMIDHLISGSAEDRDDLAQHATDVPRAVLQSLLAFTTFDFHDTSLESHHAASGIVSCLRIFASMSNISHAWSCNLQSVEGTLNALARVMNDREAISARILSIGEKVTDPIDNADGGELLCLVLAIVTSAALVDEKLSPHLAILKLNKECRIAACLRSCKCPPAESFVNELARLYTSFHSKEAPDADTEVVAAYLALLLSKVITAAPATLVHIEPSLPGDSTELRLRQLLESLRSLDSYRSTLQTKIKAEIGADGAEWQEEGNEVQRAIDDLTRLVAESV